MKNSTFVVSENTIMWAFRYALGRRTGAVTDVIQTLKSNWGKLEDRTQIQIQDEIRTAIRQDRAGAKFDVEDWEEILALPSTPPKHIHEEEFEHIKFNKKDIRRGPKVNINIKKTLPIQEGGKDE